MDRAQGSCSGRSQGCLVLFLVFSCAAGASAQSSESPPLQGPPLAAVLRDLQRDGLPLVFTEQLVDSTMRVLEEPTTHTPRALLEEVLAPWGLSVRATGDGTLVVVPGEKGRREIGRLEGFVRAALSGRGIPGASVHARLQPGGSIAGRPRRSSSASGPAKKIEKSRYCFSVPTTQSV